jgi:hypothetical protein
MNPIQIIMQAQRILKDAGCKSCSEYIENVYQKGSDEKTMNKNKKKKVAYACDRLHGRCTPSAYGEYSSLRSCQESCKGVPNDVMGIIDSNLSGIDISRLSSTSKEEFPRLLLLNQFGRTKQLLNIIMTPKIHWGKLPVSKPTRTSVHIRVNIDHTIVLVNRRMYMVDNDEYPNGDNETDMDEILAFLKDEFTTQLYFLRKYRNNEDNEDFFVAMLAIFSIYDKFPYIMYRHNRYSVKPIFSAKFDFDTLISLSKFYNLSTSDNAFKLESIIETTDNGKPIMCFKTRIYDDIIDIDDQ